MFEMLDHTGDIRLRITSPTLDGMYRDALRGLMAILKPVESSGEDAVERTLIVESADPTTLLVDFLNEVLWSAETHREAYEAIEIRTLSDRGLDALIRGRTVTSFGEEIKAVTYHQAEVARKGDMWETMLVFDV